jgi:predicted dehydrogenase
MPQKATNDPSRRQFLAASGAVGTGLMAAGALRASDTPLAPPDKQPPNLKVPEPVAKKVRWAIVGLGQLALEEVLPAFGSCRLCVPTGLVSGHPAKARQVAKVYGIDPQHIYDYDNYDKLADDSEIDVIYNILPNNMHAEFTIRALQAGKHVLCEKPMAANVEECEQMIAAAEQAKRKLMIAYRLRYEPFNRKAIELCRSELGKLKLISASNSQNVQAPNIRLSEQLKGGPLGDVGVYCLNACRYLTGKEPVEVSAFSHHPQNDPRFREVPESVSFMLRFADGLEAHCSCSFGTSESRFFRVEGSEGVLKMDHAYSYFGQELFLRDSDGERKFKLKPVDHFAAEMDHFSECILQNKRPLTPGEEGLADMRVIAAIEEAARTGKVVRVRNG